MFSSKELGYLTGQFFVGFPPVESALLFADFAYYFVVSALRFVDHCHQFAPLYTLLWAPLVFPLPVRRRFFPRVN